MIEPVAILASIVLAAAAAPNAAALVRSAEPPPVRVTSCRTVLEPHARGVPAQEAIQVSFSNNHDSPADVARSLIRTSTGQWRAFTARGSFSKGVIIADRILPSESSVEEHFFSREQYADCALTYVHFEDGSAWMAAP
jgi:hypothetical protein